MDKGLIKDLEKRFDSMKEDLDFSVSFDEINSEFFLRDAILEAEFVPENFMMFITSRIVDYFRKWAAYLNGLLIPQQGVYISQTEAKLFNGKNDKEEIWRLLNVCMYFSSLHSSMYLNNDKEKQRLFIDSGYDAWVNDLKPGLAKIMSKVNSAWKGK